MDPGAGDQGRPGDSGRLPLRRRRHGQALLLRTAARGDPLRGVPASATTEIRLEPEGVGTEVTLESRQRLKGLSRLGGFDDAASDGPHLGGGIARPRASGGRAGGRRGGPELTTELKWWGWGGRRPPCSGARGDALGAGRGAGHRAGRRDRAGLARAGWRCRRARADPRSRARRCGEGGLLTADEDRVRRAAGRSYPDLVRLRSGRRSSWLRTRSASRRSSEQVAALLAACAEAGVAVVPFGGGSSVVGGLDAVAGGALRRDRARPRRGCATSRSTAPR